MALFSTSRALLLRPSHTLQQTRPFIWGLYKFTRDKRLEKGPHPIDHATGHEKMLLILNEEKGIEDPYMIDKMYPRGPATKDNPCLVPSFNPEKAAIGCHCEEDQLHIRYMWVHANEPKRCECGHWFKLVEAKDLMEVAYGKTEDSPEMY